jgi:hypothetical protein
MSAEEHLSQQLFHGTAIGGLRKGTHIKPASQLPSHIKLMTGGTNYSLSSPNHVYVTSDPERAKWFANTAHDRLTKVYGSMGLKWHGQPTVYQVEPLGNLEADPNETDFETKGTHKMIKGRAKVVKTVWSKE